MKTILKENLSELFADKMLLHLDGSTLHTFWLKRKTEYPQLTAEALECASCTQGIRNGKKYLRRMEKC